MNAVDTDTDVTLGAVVRDLERQLDEQRAATRLAMAERDRLTGRCAALEKQREMLEGHIRELQLLNERGRGI